VQNGSRYGKISRGIDGSHAVNMYVMVRMSLVRNRDAQLNRSQSTNLCTSQYVSMALSLNSLKVWSIVYPCGLRCGPFVMKVDPSRTRDFPQSASIFQKSQ
jgi:hypothetical protein